MATVRAPAPARPPSSAAYPLQARIKTAAVSALLTSLLWIVFMVLYWPRDHAPPPMVASQPLVAPPMPAPASAARASGLLVPVQGVAPSQLVDTWAQARSGGRTHDAIDIMAPRGTPVLAAAPGKVEKLFQSKLGGTTLYERSADGSTIYYYAHLDSYAPGVTEGVTLAQGQTLGFVGSTGDADPSAPHLHFAVMRMAPGEPWWKGQAVDPYPLLGGR